MPDRDAAETRKAFAEAVNMTPAELEKWLATPRSKGVGFRRENAREAVGHASGRRIVEIKRKRVAALDAADYRHMRKVAAYVRRHLAQRPQGDVRDTRWRFSLMNWGHDPLK